MGLPCSENPFLYVGSIIHSISSSQIEFLKDGVVVVKDNVIVNVSTSSKNLDDLCNEFSVPDSNVIRLSNKQFLIPGFVDTHIHASQYPNCGIGYQLPLLDWLKEYTFPLEMKFSDTDFAARVYEAAVMKALKSGTTTASYLATIHTEGSLILAQIVQRLNQRAFIGKVNMNMNSPEDYIETTEESIAATKQFLKDFPKNRDLIQPVITPRFAVSCDMTLMKKLADIAVEQNARIQTHVSENQEEIQTVANLFPECKSYADVYDKAGLLTNNTILAHGVYLTDDELQLIKKKGTALSHCPNSNISLQSGLCLVRRFLDYGLKVGLGSDCSGGYSLSIIDAMRHALETSVCISFAYPELKPLTIAEVFFMATLGGAQALGIDNTVGNFQVGKRFDALVIDLGTFDLFEFEHSLEQLFAKFIYLGDDRNIIRVYVDGRISAEVDKKILDN